MRNLYTSLLFCGLAALGSASMDARVLNPAEALARVNATAGRQQLAAKGIRTGSAVPALTVKSASGQQPALYVFNSEANNSYMVVAADDIVDTPLLGYTDSGAFNPNNVAPAFQYWMDCYAQEIEDMRNAGVTPNTEASANSLLAIQRAERKSIPVMCATRWNQDAPYNNDCPLMGTQRTYTGCVATAMAQVLKYYDWPSKGTGTKSYRWEAGNKTLMYTYSTKTFDWANMTNQYTSASTTVEKAAVANLMYACGVSVEMGYGTSASGAQSWKVPGALVDNFKMSPNVRWASRETFGLADWETMAYENLVNYGPIYYSGHNESAGHAFVCDGYSQGGYFHFNWGWGGMSDGYFRLFALNPDSQGIGGSASGYNMGQNMILQVSKAATGDKLFENMIMTAPFKLNGTVRKGSPIAVSSACYNYSASSLSTVTLGLCFKSPSGEITWAPGEVMSALKPSYGTTAYSVTVPTTLTSTTYTVTPAFKGPSGVWKEMPHPIAGPTYWTISMSGTTGTMTPAKTSDLTVSNYEAKSPFYLKNKFLVNCNLTNNSGFEFFGNIRAAFCKMENGNLNPYAYGEAYPMDVLNGESTLLEYYSDFVQPSSSFTAGTYTMVFIDEEGNIIGNFATEVTIKAAPTATGKIACTAFSVANADNVNATDVKFSGTFVGQTAYVTANPTIYIFNGNGQGVLNSMPAGPVFLEPGKMYNFNLSMDFSQGVVGTKYLAAIFNGSTQLSNLISFTIGSNAGVEDITMDTEAVSTEYYNLSGVRIQGVPTAAGLYIRKDRMADGSVRSSRQVIK